jgi:hypothetical protein
VSDTLGLVGDALAAVEEARLHGYCGSAALMAAVDHLETATQAEAVAIAGVLAMWLATEMKPTLSIDLAMWVELTTKYLADRQAAA